MKKRKSVTMQDIASELGLSRLTVSSVVNGHARKRGISENTVSRVKKHLEKRGFVPSKQALELKQQSSSAVGILHSGRLYSHLTEAFNTMADTFSSDPRQLEIMVVPRQRLVNGIRELLSRGVSTLVWIHTHGPAIEFSDPSVKNYLDRVRTIIYNYRFGEPESERQLLSRGYHLVGVDRPGAYVKLARFLKKLGHTKIAFPELEKESLAWRDKCFRKNGMEIFHPGQDPVRKLSPEQTGVKMARALAECRQKQGITAACFGDDEITGFALAEFARMGIRVPDDLTVTGFDGLSLAAAFNVPLTTLKMPVRDMVKKVEQLLKKRSREKKFQYPMKLVKRKSHCAVNNT